MRKMRSRTLFAVSHMLLDGGLLTPTSGRMTFFQIIGDGVTLERELSLSFFLFVYTVENLQQKISATSF